MHLVNLSAHASMTYMVLSLKSSAKTPVHSHLHILQGVELRPSQLSFQIWDEPKVARSGE